MPDSSRALPPRLLADSARCRFRLGLAVTLFILLAAGAAAADEDTQDGSTPRIQTTFRLFGDVGASYESRPPIGVEHGSFAVGSIDFFLIDAN